MASVKNTTTCCVT